MSKTAAIGFLVIGLLFIVAAIIIWWHMFRDDKRHSKWVTFCAAVGAVGVGLGVGALSQKIATLASYGLGPIPLWIPVVGILGLIFVLQFMGNKDHHIRTPALGILTAFVLFTAVGHSVVDTVVGATHDVKPTTQTASNVKPKG